MGRPGAIVNISGTTPVDDPEYRYKMPTVYGKLEGRGNGSKTVIPNISDVALSLHRDPGEVNKFFGCEMGAQTTYNAETDRAVVNGHHQDKTLQQMVHKYIQAYVLCPNCGLPETEYKIKSGIIYHKCAACGAKEMVDMSHKLCTYILAQDKKAKADAKKAGKKKRIRRRGRKTVTAVGMRKRRRKKRRNPRTRRKIKRTRKRRRSPRKINRIRTIP